MSIAHLTTVEQRLLRLSRWVIHHNANHIRSKVDGIKIMGTRHLRPQWYRS